MAPSKSKKNKKTNNGMKLRSGKKSGLKKRPIANKKTAKNIKPKSSKNTGPELVFGLIGPVGTDLDSVSKALVSSLDDVGYQVHKIKLTDELIGLGLTRGIQKVKSLREDERILRLMTEGTSFREKWKDGNAVSLLGINRIWEIRQAHWVEGKAEDRATRPIPGTAYIFHSLKHMDEVETLREIYKDKFILISLFEAKHKRIDRLVRKIRDSDKNRKNDEEYRTISKELIRIDQKEINPLGQSVGEIFHEADLFVASTDSDKKSLAIPAQVDRFIKLLFGAPFITPTKDEYGIFHAHSVSLKSADLSRQVGAIILTENAEIISAGCNEVPSIGGPPYWEGEDKEERPDTRDFNLGRDPNAFMKDSIVDEVFEALKSNKWLKASYAKMNAQQLRDKALYGAKILKEKRVANIIEFGRIVHAEMSAITDAARRGLATKDAILYCTTYPCHVCARHILAAGIKRVVFVEPYTKSMTQDMYNEIVEVDGDNTAHPNAASFEPFIGVSHRRFFKLFSAKEGKLDRKDTSGKSTPENSWRADPLLDSSNDPVYTEVEGRYLKNLRVFISR